MTRSLSSIDVFERRARDYQAKYMSVELYHEALDRLCMAVQTLHADVLEVGCGPGNVTRYLLQQRPDLRILAVDLAPTMLKLARINNPHASFRLMDCRDIRSLAQRYHAIVSAFCLPYLSREEAIQFIADAAASLQPSGAIYLSTMEGDYSASGPQRSSDGKDSTYVYIHQADYLVEALRANGFTVVHESRKSYAAPSGANTIDLMIVATL
jgi:cyclopropane fatty-acyl-phospholipid synthase-like methyltransferase